MDKKEVINFLKNTKFQWALAIIALLAIIIISSSIRFSNWDSLVDETTGELVPSDIDAFYFLRITETIAEKGNLPEYDYYRYNPSFQVGWHTEIMPKTIILLQKFVSPWYGLREVFLASPIIFLIITLGVLFTLAYLLTNSKFAAILSVAFLAFVPGYLMRTMGGFADHDAFGMMFFIFAILIYFVALSLILRKKENIYYTVFGGILAGLATTLSIVSWGGIAKFLFIVIPLSFFLLWLSKTRESREFNNTGITFYVLWLASAILGSLIFNYGLKAVLDGYVFAAQGVLSLFVLFFVIVDSILGYQKKVKIKEKFRTLYSLVITAILGILSLTLIGKNVLSIMKKIIQSFLEPFGSDRFGTTVAENQAPYLSDWIAQTGDVLFWLFILGIVLLGVQISRGVKNIKRKIIFAVAYIFMAFGIIFSNISETHILNGNNFISGAFYLLPLLFFWGYLFWLHSKEGLKITAAETVIFSWMFITIISGRAAARMFFPIMPFICFMGAYFIYGLFREFRNSKDETYKYSAFILFILTLLASVIAINSSYEYVSAQSNYVGASADSQWQRAMEWVRNNTAEESIFVHWWDYGYWIESLGERRTVADGGHFQEENIIHKIGRYVLTTPYPETALSFFKSMDNDYLLIDPSDLGKYPAYARIGSDESWDRYSFLPVGLINPSQTYESQNVTKSIYILNGVVDKDLYYNSSSGAIFLPGPTYSSTGTPSYKAGIGGVILSTSNNAITGLDGVFIYNGQRYDLPIRYIYINGEIHDFGKGIDAVVMVIPAVEQSSQGAYVNPMGGIIYMTPMVGKSLFAQLYLMDDVWGNYEGVELVHSEDDPVVSSLKTQNNFTSDFLYYGTLRGPIKIWDVRNISDNILERSEFYEPLNGDYGGLDNLEFTK